MTAPTIAELKEAYRIPDAWRDLALEGRPGKTCCSPFREDRNPSFSIFDDGRRWRDFATDEAGDVIDFVRLARAVDTKGAVEFITDRLGHVRRCAATAAPKAKWPELRAGTPAEFSRLNEQRGFSVAVLREAEVRGFLHFGTQWDCGFWGVTDRRRGLIELRRTTGEPWRAFGRLAERKAHCIGTGKRIPIGVEESAGFPKIAFCEGAPDFLAALHLAETEGKTETVAPVAMLGAGTGRIDATTLRLFRGKHVRLFPHLDAAGRNAARRWARQLLDAGAESVDAFDFSGLICCDELAGKDLADVCRIDYSCWEAKRKFWQVLP